MLKISCRFTGYIQWTVEDPIEGFHNSRSDQVGVERILRAVLKGLEKRGRGLWSPAGIEGKRIKTPDFG